MMSAAEKPNFGSAKLIAIIAIGVVSGLALWTLGNGILGEWQKSRREKEAAQKEAESERRIADSLKRSQAWDKIMLDSRILPEHQNTPNTSGAPRRHDGTLRSRIEGSSTYKSRLLEIGEAAMREELKYELLISTGSMEEHLNTPLGRKSSSWDDNMDWLIEAKNLLKELSPGGN